VPDTAETALGEAFGDDLAEHPGLPGFHTLGKGLDAFAALEENDKGEKILAWQSSINGENQRYTTQPNTGFWHRFGVGLRGMLPMDSLLGRAAKNNTRQTTGSRRNYPRLRLSSRCHPHPDRQRY
jgi:hypothetical protein